MIFFLWDYILFQIEERNFCGNSLLEVNTLKKKNVKGRLNLALSDGCHRAQAVSSCVSVMQNHISLKVNPQHGDAIGLLPLSHILLVYVTGRSDGWRLINISNGFILWSLGRATAAWQARGARLQYLLPQHQSGGVKGELDSINWQLLTPGF